MLRLRSPTNGGLTWIARRYFAYVGASAARPTAAPRGSRGTTLGTFVAPSSDQRPNAVDCVGGILASIVRATAAPSGPCGYTSGTFVAPPSDERPITVDRVRVLGTREFPLSDQRRHPMDRAGGAFATLWLRHPTNGCAPVDRAGVRCSRLRFHRPSNGRASMNRAGGASGTCVAPLSDQRPIAVDRARSTFGFRRPSNSRTPVDRVGELRVRLWLRRPTNG